VAQSECARHFEIAPLVERGGICGKFFLGRLHLLTSPRGSSIRTNDEQGLRTIRSRMSERSWNDIIPHQQARTELDFIAASIRNRDMLKTEGLSVPMANG
jgi:hypothetical protein